jgi:hypothetical protein
MPETMARTWKKYLILTAVLWVCAFVPVERGSAAIPEHDGLTTYEGSKSCSTATCHVGKALEVHGSAMYQLKGATPMVPNLLGQIAGKLGQINDFCTYPDINWLFQMTNTAGDTVVAGCGACHVGMGAKPEPTPTPAQLENIDCLICHSEVYKRKVVIDPPGSAPRFVPAPPTTIPPTSTEEFILQSLAAIQKTPSTATCLTRCHTGAGGGAKQGDIHPVLDPTPAQDFHLASKANGGAGLSCLDCHKAEIHRILGRGNDIRETEYLKSDPTVPPFKVDCQNCHAINTTTRPFTPHPNNQDLNRHAARVDCTVCHIPTFSRSRPTEMYRDFTQTEIEPAVKRWEPVRTYATNVVPAYRWFNDQSYFYEFGAANLGQSANFRPAGNFLLSSPLGDILDSKAKIHAFKWHKAKMAYDLDQRRLIPTKSKVLWETGNLEQTFLQGAAEVGWTISGYAFSQSNRFLSLHHEVPTKESALKCADCHVSTGRMNFKELGYFLKTTTPDGKPLCTSCHGRETGDFYQIHNEHVRGEGIGCTTCHVFKAQPVLAIPPVITPAINLLMSD